MKTLLVKKGSPPTARFLPGTVVIETGRQEAEHTPSWIMCKCYDAEGDLIGEASFSQSYIEFNTL